MYLSEEEAVHYVFSVFHGMDRKKEPISLASHSIMVGIMLKNSGCEESTVIAGFLHDVLEDSMVSYEDLALKFGTEIADLVLQVTEDQTISNWKERKENVIRQLETASKEVLMIELADKLHNLLSDYSLFLQYGKESLNTEAGSYDELKWYYETLKTLFHNHLKTTDLLIRYDSITTLYFGE